MSQPHKWWWGLIPTALIWAGSDILLEQRVQRDLATRSQAALTDSVFMPSVSVTGRDVVIGGTIFDAGDAARLSETVGTQWGVRRVSSLLALPANRAPYDWGLTRSEDGSVTLTGSVPNPEARASIIAIAEGAWPGATITDEMSYASGAPVGYAASIGTAISAVTGLEAPGIVLSNSEVSLSGRAPLRSSLAAVESTLAGLPSGTSADTSGIELPAPYAFGAELSDAGLNLSGAVPSEEIRGEIEAYAARQFSGIEIQNALEIDPDSAPDGFLNAVQAGLSALSRLGAGRFGFSGSDVSFGGDALYATAAARIEADLRADLPAGFAAPQIDLAVRPIGAPMALASCLDAVDSILARSTILFETGSAALDRTSSGVLDRIAATLLRCPGTMLEIAGHTDSTGSPAANMDLSGARAASVLDYLLGAGLASNDFISVGYGQTQPIASNATEEGRARNRRITFSAR